MPAIDEAYLKAVAADVEGATGARIRALDLFYYDEFPSNSSGEFVSYSYGEDIYLEAGGVLETFFSKHGSLARADSSTLQSGSIPSTAPQTCSPKMQFAKIVPSPALQTSSVEQLLRHLEQCNFGRFYLLTTVHHLVRTIKVHVSTFVVFDCELSHEHAQAAERAVLWWMLSDVTNIITTSFSNEIIRAREEEALAKRLIKTLRHLLKNIPFKDNLYLLGLALENCDLEAAKRKLQTVKNQQKLRDLITASVYSARGLGEALRNGLGISKYTDIIRLLHEGDANHERVTIDGCSEHIEGHPANHIPIEGMVDGLTVIVNIWTNATSNGDVKIVYEAPEVHPPCLKITFVNKGILNASFKEFLNRESSFGPRSGEGLRHIRDVGDRRPDLRTTAETDLKSNQTSVTVTIQTQ